MLNSSLDNGSSKGRALVIATIGLAPLTGVASVLLGTQGLYWVPLAFVGGLIWLGVLIPNWKWAVYGLLLYLPFAGVPVVVFYPSQAPLLFKDFLFVIPAYVGFFLIRGKGKFLLSSGAPTGWLAAFVMMVILQMFNPASAGLLLGLVGLKVWLFYIPLYFLAYHLVDSKEQLLRLAKFMLAVALVPTAIGIVEAVLLSAGNSGLVYAFYGAAANSVFHGFRYTDLGAAALQRIPSTFTLEFQYFNFCLSMLAISYAVWRGVPVVGRTKTMGLLVLVFLALAGILSGAKAAFILIPIYFVLTQMLDRGLRRFLVLALALIAGLGLAMAILGASLYGTYALMSDIALSYAFQTQPAEFLRAVQTTLLGLGTGMNTGPARYVADSATFFGIENYYGKAVVELGIPGLIIVVALFLTILKRGYTNHLRLGDPELRAFSTGLLVYLALIMIYLWKGWFLDLDPTNVYFWFFAGLLARLPDLEKQKDTITQRVPAKVYGK